MRIVMFIRAKNTRHELWKRVPEVYRNTHFEMSRGGIKNSSHKTYYNGMRDLCKTARKLKLTMSEVFTFPTDSVVQLIWIIDCAKERGNVWNTVRNKLRSLDYYAQLAGVKQNYTKNPDLFAAIQYVKKKHPGK